MYHCVVAMTGMGIVRAAGAAGMVRYLSTCGHSRADEYLSEHGRATVTWRGIGADGQLVERELDADQFDQFGRFMAGFDPDTGESRWAQAVEPQHVAAVDFLVNGPKEWSILAVLDPEVRAALLQGQVNAEWAVLRYLWENGTVQVKRAGEVVRVPVERIEIASVQHFSSRSGDPHFHRHMEISARVWAAGKWRALDSLGARNLNVAVQAIFHREQLRELRPVLEGLGYRLDEMGRIRLLRPVVEAMSRRSAQLERNLARIEADWRTEHPGKEPTARLARLWDVQAWEQQRPYKAEAGVLDDELAVWAARIGEVISENHISLPTAVLVAADDRVSVARLDRDALAAEIVEAQGLKRSAWSRADLEAAAILAVEGLVTGDPAAVDEAAADVAARALALSQLLPGVAGGVPSAAVKWFTSVGVIARENELRTGLAVLVAEDRLSVVEGAAGAGKTTSLAEHVAEAADAGQRVVLVAPTGAAANVAAGQAGVEASTVDRFLLRHGWDRNSAGGWEWIEPHAPADALPTGGRLVVDEAGMVSQDAARALVMTAIRNGWQVRVQGDSFQFGAVGVGGVIELAKQAADPGRVWLLDDANDVHRFQLPNGDRDEVYAAHSVALRTGADPEQAARTVMEHADVYSSEAERVARVAGGWAQRAHAGTGLVIAGTNEQVQLLNGLIRDQLVTAGTIKSGKTITTMPLQGRWGSETISAGDVVATRVNSAGTDGGRYANRERWRVRAVDPDGGLGLVSLDGRRAVHLDAQAAGQHVQLAYAVTGYGAQGLTVDEAVQLVDDGTDRPGFYVGATRGRYTNQTALVAENADPDLARRQVEDILGQPGADTGWRAADLHARADRERMGDLVDLHSVHVPPMQPEQEALVEPAPPPDTDRLARVAQVATEQAETAEREAAAASLLERAAQVAARYASQLAAIEKDVGDFDTARAAQLAADRSGLVEAIAFVDQLRRTASDLEHAVDNAGLLHRGQARRDAADARQAAQDAEHAFRAAWGHDRGTDMAPQAAERIAYARVGRWRYRIASAKRDADNIRAQGRDKILAALRNIHPSWVDRHAHDLESAVRPDQPDLAQDRLHRAAASLRESSSERAKLASDLQAASPQERVDWLTQREAGAARASEVWERIQPTTHRVRPEDEHPYHRPDRGITPGW